MKRASLAPESVHRLILTFISQSFVSSSVGMPQISSGSPLHSSLTMAVMLRRSLLPEASSKVWSSQHVPQMGESSFVAATVKRLEETPIA